MTQLQGRDRELDVRLNLPNLAKKGPPMTRLAVMAPTFSQHRNMIPDDIVSLAQYGLHYRGADEPLITNTLQLLLHECLDRTLLEKPHTNKCCDATIHFTVTGNILEHTPY